MIDKIEYPITSASHPVLYYNWIQLRSSKRFLLFKKLKTINARLERSCQNIMVQLTVASKESIRSQGASSLGTAFQSMSDLYTLKLTIQKENQIGNEGLKGLMSGISTLKKLCEFDLTIGQKNQIGDESVLALSAYLENLTSLKQLKIELYQCNISSSSISQLYSSVGRLINLRLLSLNISKKQLSVQDMMESIKSLSTLTLLKKLSLILYYQEDNESQALSRIADTFFNLAFIEDLSLALLSKNMGDKSISYLNSGISSLKKLKSLQLEFPRHQLIHVDYSSIFHNFSQLKDLTNLRVESLHCKNKNIQKEDLQCYDQMINDLKQCPQIENLTLNFQSPCIYKVIELINYLKKLKKEKFNIFKNSTFNYWRNEATQEITVLDLHQCQLPLEIQSLGYLFSGFQSLSMLHTLNYSHKPSYKLKGVQLFSSALKYLTNLNTLYIKIEKRSEILSEGIIIISQNLGQLKNLAVLSLTVEEENKIDFGGVKELFLILSTLQALKRFDFDVDYSNQIFKLHPLSKETELEPLSQLVRLTISLNDYEINEKGLIILSDWIEKLKSLQFLDFTLRQAYDDEKGFSALELGKSIQKLKNLKKLRVGDTTHYSICTINPINNNLVSSLEELELSTIKLNKESVKTLSSFLSSLQNLITLRLQISNTQLTLDDFLILNEGIKKLCKLKKLYFDFYSYYSYNKTPFISESIRFLPFLKYLSTLRLKLYIKFQGQQNQYAKRKCIRLVNLE